MKCAKLITALLFFLGGISLSTVTPASARGGAAANIMGSPGYQRALEESRKRYRESATQPRVQPSKVHKRKKQRHYHQR